MPEDWRADKKLAAEYVVWKLDTRFDFSTGQPRELKQPGDFANSLIDALCHADKQNRELIGLGFPALAWAVGIYKDRWDGVNGLRQLVGVEQNPAWETVTATDEEIMGWSA